MWVFSHSTAALTDRGIGPRPVPRAPACSVSVADCVERSRAARRGRAEVRDCGRALVSSAGLSGAHPVVAVAGSVVPVVGRGRGFVFTGPGPVRRDEPVAEVLGVRRDGRPASARSGVADPGTGADDPVLGRGAPDAVRRARRVTLSAPARPGVLEPTVPSAASIPGNYPRSDPRKLGSYGIDISDPIPRLSCDADLDRRC